MSFFVRERFENYRDMVLVVVVRMEQLLHVEHILPRDFDRIAERKRKESNINISIVDKKLQPNIKKTRIRYHFWWWTWIGVCMWSENYNYCQINMI